MNVQELDKLLERLVDEALDLQTKLDKKNIEIQAIKEFIEKKKENPYANCLRQPDFAQLC